MESYDVAVVGAGIVGLATTLNLLQRAPKLRVVVLEKEASVALHQTGHNSGVLHSGIYYRPGSSKATLCTLGVRAMRRFCDEHDVPYQLCGKVIVATEASELPALAELEQRGRANGVRGLRRLEREELVEIEPQARGIAALYSPETGIVDYGLVAQSMAAEAVNHGAQLLLGHAVRSIRTGDQQVIETNVGEVRTRVLVNCAGLQADRVAQLAGVSPGIQIVPFRGEYFTLRPDRVALVRGLIYPVPDPRLPFLGVHFTRRIQGGVECGPNAVLALAREGYNWSRMSVSDLTETLAYTGFWHVAARYWRVGAFELYRSLNRRVFAASLARLVPEVGPDDLVPSGAGVRAQAVAPDGRLIDDFVIEESEHSVHVLNAPSPAATASISIGAHVAERVLRKILPTGLRHAIEETGGIA